MNQASSKVSASLWRISWMRCLQCFSSHLRENTRLAKRVKLAKVNDTEAGTLAPRLFSSQASESEESHDCRPGPNHTCPKASHMHTSTGNTIQTAAFTLLVKRNLSKRVYFIITPKYNNGCATWHFAIRYADGSGELNCSFYERIR